MSWSAPGIVEGTWRLVECLQQIGINDGVFEGGGKDRIELEAYHFSSHPTLTLLSL